MQHKAEQLHSREARFGDPRIAQKEAERDSQFLRQVFSIMKSANNCTMIFTGQLTTNAWDATVRLMLLI